MTYIPPKSRVGRLLTGADRLEAWLRAQSYLTGVQGASATTEYTSAPGRE